MSRDKFMKNQKYVIYLRLENPTWNNHLEVCDLVTYKGDLKKNTIKLCKGDGYKLLNFLRNWDKINYTNFYDLYSFKLLGNL